MAAREKLPLSERVYNCYYCNLTHPEVEAGGMWYCPNPLCTGPGGDCHRRKCKSYRAKSNSRSTVDSDEWAELGMAASRATCDEKIIEAASASMLKLAVCLDERTP